MAVKDERESPQTRASPPPNRADCGGEAAAGPNRAVSTGTGGGGPYHPLPDPPPSRGRELTPSPPNPLSRSFRRGGKGGEGHITPSLTLPPQGGGNSPPPPSAGESGGGGPPAGNVIGWVREQVALGTPLRFRVTSDSMAPLLIPGDEVMVAAAPPETLRPGDLVVAAAPGAALFVVHRLVALRREGDGFWLVTRGDRSSTPDPAWPAEAIVGRVVAVVRAGQTLDLRRGRGRAMALAQGVLARLEAATYTLLRNAAYRLPGRRVPRLGRVVRAPFQALMYFISRGLKLRS